jgi:hypothetical protein
MTDEDAQVTEEQWDKECEEWRRDQANIEHVEGKAAQISNYKDKAEPDNVVKNLVQGNTDRQESSPPDSLVNASLAQEEHLIYFLYQEHDSKA